MADEDRGRSLTQAMRSLQEGLHKAGPGVAAGYSVMGALILFGGSGYLIDRWRGTEPTYLTAGLLLGVVVGLYLVARDVWRR
jgi:prepilin signal peptidase PulO-like enzyme (type II secretory pathway)